MRDFSTNRTRYRIPLETRDAREAKAREKDKIADARDGRLAVAGLSKARLGFKVTMDKYLAEIAMVRQDKRENSCKTWEGYLTERLRPFFRGKRLGQITAEDIRPFQAQRLEAGIHPNTSNHEVKALFRLLWSYATNHVTKALPEASMES